MEPIIYTTRDVLKFYDENGNTVALPITSFKTLGKSIDDLTETFNSVAVSLEDITIPIVVSATESEDLNEDPIDLSEFLNT